MRTSTVRRLLGVAVSCGLLLSVLAAPSAVAATTLVDCRTGADLQAAIDAADPGDTLVIRGTCVGNFVVAKKLTLAGLGTSATLDAGGSGSTVVIAGPLAVDDPPIPATIVGLRITGGDPGLTVEERGSVSLERSWVVGNSGDGISHAPRSKVLLQDTWVRGNGGDGVFSGGPLASLTLKNSTISDNAGYGLYAMMQAGVVLINSTVSHNGGRGIENENASVTLDHSTVVGNAGGGIFVSFPAYLFMSRSTVVGNTAPTSGGGLYVERAPASGGVTIEDSTFVKNTAGTSGGGLYIAFIGGGNASLTNVMFANNTAGTSGGGLYIEGSGVPTLSGITFHHNTPDDCVGC